MNGRALLSAALLSDERHGTGSPIVTHVGFGLVGGACGAILARGLPRRGRPEDAAGGAGHAD